MLDLIQTFSSSKYVRNYGLGSGNIILKRNCFYLQNICNLVKKKYKETGQLNLIRKSREWKWRQSQQSVWSNTQNQRRDWVG